MAKKGSHQVQHIRKNKKGKTFLAGKMPSNIKNAKAKLIGERLAKNQICDICGENFLECKGHNTSEQKAKDNAELKILIDRDFDDYGRGIRNIKTRSRIDQIKTRLLAEENKVSLTKYKREWEKDHYVAQSNYGDKEYFPAKNLKDAKGKIKGWFPNPKVKWEIKKVKK